MAWLTVLKFLAPFLIGGAIAGGAIWTIRGAQVDSEKAARQQVQTQLTTCQDTNKTYQGTVAALESDVKKCQGTCSQRIALKEATMNRIRQIDDLPKGAVHEAEAKNPENGAGADSGIGVDPVLDMLNGMFDSSKPDRKAGVYKAADSFTSG